MGPVFFSGSIPSNFLNFRDIPDPFFVVPDVPYLGSGAGARIDGVCRPREPHVCSRGPSDVDLA